MTGAFVMKCLTKASKEGMIVIDPVGKATTGIRTAAAE